LGDLGVPEERIKSGVSLLRTKQTHNIVGTKYEALAKYAKYSEKEVMQEQVKELAARGRLGERYERAARDFNQEVENIKRDDVKLQEREKETQAILEARRAHDRGKAALKFTRELVEVVQRAPIVERHEAKVADLRSSANERIFEQAKRIDPLLVVDLVSKIGRTAEQMEQDRLHRNVAELGNLNIQNPQAAAEIAQQLQSHAQQLQSHAQQLQQPRNP